MEIEHGNLEDFFSAVICALLCVVVQKAGGLDLRPGLEVVLAVAALDFDVCFFAVVKGDGHVKGHLHLAWRVRRRLVGVKLEALYFPSDGRRDEGLQGRVGLLGSLGEERLEVDV